MKLIWPVDEGGKVESICAWFCYGFVMRNLIWFMLEREIIWEVIRVRFSLWIHRLGLVCSVDCFRSCLNLWAPPLCSLLSKCAYMLLFVAGYQAVAWCHWYYLWLAAREGHWNWANIHCSCSIQKWEWYSPQVDLLFWCLAIPGDTDLPLHVCTCAESERHGRQMGSVGYHN